MVPLLTPAHLLVRWLHVLAMAVAVGGAALAFGVVAAADDRTALAVAAVYEAAFWGALGVLAATGVGNLGALAPAIPGGRWGATLSAKLALVLAVLVGSAVRTALVCLRRPTPADPAPPSSATLRSAYALTTAALVAVVGLAEVLAHG